AELPLPTRSVSLQLTNDDDDERQHQCRWRFGSSDDDSASTISWRAESSWIFIGQASPSAVFANGSKAIVIWILLSLDIYSRFCLRHRSSGSVAHISSVVPFGAENCRSIKGLNKRQVRLCRQNTDLMGSMKMGALMSIMECQYQFRSRRWNCSVVDRSVLFGRVLDLGTREAAFVHAVTSAGATFMITRDCSSGKLEKCGCDRSYNGFNREGFHWAGCSDNIRYGAAFTRQFVDAHERRKHKSLELVQMNLHNNEAGRKIIERHMKTQCKCHGVSGSCELKTCWRAMPSFREIGQMLKAKFDGATEVKLGQVNYRPGLIPAHSQFKPHTAEDLVYLHESPDYCVANNKTGSLGTVGRVCNKTSKAIDGCELLCCGRGFVTRYERLVERCHCKFHWCCFVRCKECVRTVEVNICL
ncbi:hypothetical protein M513_00461, partial [Trichuris suis]